MKLFSLLMMTVFVFIFFGMQQAFAGVCHAHPGNTVCEKGEVTEVTAYGSVLLNGTHVKEKTDISGSFVADNVELNYLIVKGQASIHSGLVKGSAEIFGSLDASKTTFKDDLLVYSTHVSLTDVDAKNITFGKSEPSSAQELYLSGKTNISGDIRFEQENGVVYVAEGSHLSGNVIGGKIINK
jgi:hypothetical protein